MLQEQSRDAVPQELSALIELQQGMQTGKVAPTTPQGQPTVAAQMAGAAQQQMAPQMAPQMPMGSPAVNQVAQQAGLAAQIQAMRQQQMQQAMMQQAAQATQRPPMMAAGGVASLNPNIRGFKHGGIVGYAGDDESAVIDPQFGGTTVEEGEPRLYAPQEGRRMTVAEMRAAGYPEDYIQRRLRDEGFISREAAPVRAAPAAAAPSAPPPAPPSPPPPGSAPARAAAPAAPRAPSQMQLAEQEIAAVKEAAQYKPRVAMPGDVVEDTMERIRVRNELARRLGLDPEMLTKQAQEAEDYYRRGEAKLSQRQAELEARAPTEGRLRALLGMRGRRFSDVVSAGAASGMAYDEAVRNQVARFEDLKMQMEGLRIDKVNTLKQLKYSTDMGEIDKAMAARQRLFDIDAAQKKAEGEAARAALQARTQLAQTEEMAASRRAQMAQGADVKVAAQLRDNMELMRKIEADVQNKYKTDKSITAYEVLRMSGQPVPDSVVKAYEDKQQQINDEIAARTKNARAEVRRLQTQLYGRPLEDATPASPSQQVPMTPGQQAALAKYGAK